MSDECSFKGKGVGSELLFVFLLEAGPGEFSSGLSFTSQKGGSDIF